MSLKLRLVSKKMGSSSLKRLQEGLSNAVGYKVWRSKFSKPNRKNVLYGDCKDKVYQYQWFEANQIQALPFTTDGQKVQQWLEEGKTVFARKLTRSCEGKGISIINPGGAVVSAPVYTQYLKKKKEYRVHVFRDQVVSVLEKRKRMGFEGERETKIRNTANGYVFCSQNVVEPDGLRKLALKASKVTNSDFKGVDIGYNEKLNQLFVIEVNSAPGIEGSNISKYVEAIVNAS